MIAPDYKKSSQDGVYFWIIQENSVSILVQSYKIGKIQKNCS